MARTTSQAFQEFARRIALTEDQRKTVHARRKAVDGFLRERMGPASTMPLEKVSLIGSAQRGTMIRPPDDIDVIAIFDGTGVWENSSFWKEDGYRHDSKKLLYRTREALTGYRVEVVGARGQAVRLFYGSSAHVDVVPAFHWDEGGFVIPAGNGDWLRTDPFAHNTYIGRRHTELDSKLKPFARKLKQWNRAHSRRLSSFHIEVMVAAIFRSVGSDSRKAARMFFNRAPDYLHVLDPAGYSGDLAQRLTSIQQRDVISSFASAAEQAAKAVRAERAGKHAEAIRLWQIVFGADLFPAYG